MPRAALALLAVLVGGCAEKLPEGHVMPLVNAERAFGRDVADHGIQAGFTAVIGDGSVLLRPDPKPAREALAAPSRDVQLSWEPVYAEMAASGDLGYTTGPFQARHRSTGHVGYGHYVSVWQKIGGKWRLVIDGGGPHPPPLDLPDRFTYAPRRKGAPSGDPAAERASLEVAEKALISAWSEPGRGVLALVEVADDDIRYYPPNSFPVAGVVPTQTALLGRSDAMTFTPKDYGVSAAGDLGFVYGDATRQTKPTAPVERGGYLRIWRRGPDGRWRVVLDLTLTERPK